MGELLVAYALDETERFLNELRVYWRASKTRLTSSRSTFACRSTTWRAATCLRACDALHALPESYAKLGKHVHELQMVLAHILSAAIAENYIPKNDIRELAMLVHGSLSSSAGRAEDAPDEETRERQILNTIRFIQMYWARVLTPRATRFAWTPRSLCRSSPRCRRRPEGRILSVAPLNRGT